MGDSLAFGLLGLVCLVLIALFVLLIRILLSPEYAAEEAEQSKEKEP